MSLSQLPVQPWYNSFVANELWYSLLPWHSCLLSAQVRTVWGRESHAVNSFAGGAPASFVTEAGSCVLNEAEHLKKGKDDLKIKTAEWSILGPNKAHSISNKVFQSSHDGSARFFLLHTSYFCSVYTGTLIFK